jgi:hypothetical protein
MRVDYGACGAHKVKPRAQPIASGNQALAMFAAATQDVVAQYNI